jgi:hypothetical protein
MRYALALMVLGSLSSLAALGQAPSPASSAAVSPSTPSVHRAGTQSGDLVVLNSVKGTVVASTWLFPMKCDTKGDLYLRNVVEGVGAVHKLNAEGKQIALLQPDSAKPSVRPSVSGHFSVGKEGYVYQLVSSWADKKRHVFVYQPDGSLKSDMVLEAGFPWLPSLVAAFPSGGLLVTGLEYDHDRKNWVKWPFTGVFALDGSLVKEVKLEDDDMIHDMAAVGDSRVTHPEAPGDNFAVQLGEMDAASDGNIYLMRDLSPAIVYAISPEGKVLRRFTVDPGDPNYVPSGMHIAGNRIALEFFQPQEGDPVIKIVDLEGAELATYRVGSDARIGAAFACYTSNPDRFVFLGGGDDENPPITVNTVGPRSEHVTLGRSGH